MVQSSSPRAVGCFRLESIGWWWTRGKEAKRGRTKQSKSNPDPKTLKKNSGAPECGKKTAEKKGGGAPPHEPDLGFTCIEGSALVPLGVFLFLSPPLFCSMSSGGCCIYRETSVHTQRIKIAEASPKRDSNKVHVSGDAAFWCCRLSPPCLVYLSGSRASTARLAEGETASCSGQDR